MTGPAATYTTTGITVSVLAGETADFYAAATDQAGNKSACSSVAGEFAPGSFVHYANTLPPGPLPRHEDHCAE